MNSQVYAALEGLQQELVRLQPAVDHVEAAQRVTEAISRLPDEQRKWITDLAKLQQEYTAESVQQIKSHISKLEAAHQAVLNQISADHSAVVEKNQADLSAHTSSLKELVREYQKEAIWVLETLSQQHESTTKAVEAENIQLSGLRERVGSYYDRIEQIDFPTRLDKLDATVAGIMASSQTTQNRIDLLERSVGEKVAALSTNLDKLETAQQQRNILILKKVNLYGVLLTCLMVFIMALVGYSMIVN